MATDNKQHEAEEQLKSTEEHEDKEVQWSDLPLEDRDREEMIKSCLLPATVKTLGWRTDSDVNNRNTLNWPPDWKGDAKGLVLAYPGLKYAKVKPHCPRVLKREVVQDRRPTATFTDNTPAELYPDDGPDDEPPKVKKYEAPFGRPHHVFNTSVICPDVNDGECPVAIIEGEKKAALLAQEGVPTLGIPGISMAHDAEARRRAWDDLKDEWIPHPELAPYLTENREVLICGDSPDMDGENMNVVREVVRIAKGVHALGCDPQIPYVPHDPKTEKSGVDDYVFREMKKVLAAHPKKTEAWARSMLVSQYTASARPALPSDLAEWLTERKEEDGSVPEIEIKRALVWCSVWFAREKKLFSKWVEGLKKKNVCKPEVLDRLVKALPKTGTEHEPMAWVTNWIGKNGVGYSYATEGFLVDKRTLPTAEFRARLEIESTNERTGISVRNIENAVRLWEADQRRQVIDQYRKKLKHLGGGRRGDAEQFIRVVTGRADSVDLAVLLHFIWQAKRKLFGLTVTNHLMPILVGRQGGGKTTAIKKLLSPLGDLVGFPGDLQFLADERQTFRLVRQYAMFFDEMGKADTMASEILKNRITSEAVEYRILGANKMQTGPNNSTFIGAANKQLKDIIFDPTGMRRFYQVNCLPKLLWAELESIDFTAMWCAVNERTDSPLDPFLPEVQRRQDAIRAKDSVEDFFDRCCSQREEWTKASVLYEQYVADLKQQCRERSAFTKTKFGERMKELTGPEDKGWKKSNGVHYRVTVDGVTATAEATLARVAAAVSPKVEGKPSNGVQPFQTESARSPL